MLPAEARSDASFPMETRKGEREKEPEKGGKKREVERGSSLKKKKKRNTEEKVFLIVDIFISFSSSCFLDFLFCFVSFTNCVWLYIKRHFSFVLFGLTFVQRAANTPNVRRYRCVG